jgi:tRNA threonylcarbamoyladenosine biosynthesis protein TsaE
VFHVDLYRIDEERDLRTLGLPDLMEREAVMLVEWGERFPHLWPPDRVEIHLRALEGEEREIVVGGG